MNSILQTVTGAACVSAAAIAAIALLGWQTGHVAWANVLPGTPGMNPLTAISILLASSSLWFLRRADPERRAKRFAQGCAGLLAAIGIIRLHSILSGHDLHLDQIIFRSQLLASTVHSRMGFFTAVASACTGAGLLSLDFRTASGWRPGEPLASVGLAVSLMAIVGYAYGASPLHGLMAVNTTFAFFLLSTAMLLARPDRGLCGLLLSGSPGGVMARRVLPTAVILPLILGWLRIQGQRAGFYGLEIGTALLALIIVGILVQLVALAGRRLNDADRERTRSEEALKRSLERQSLLLGTNVIGVLTANRDGWIVQANPAFLAMVGRSPGDLPFRTETITPPEWLGRTDTAIRELAERGIATPFEKEYMRPDGTRVPALVGAASVPGADGEVVAFVVDLSGKRRAELEVERMRMFLDSVFENLPNMVFVKDALELRFVRLNRAAEDLLGVTRDKLIGKNDYDLFPSDQADFFTEKDRSVLTNQELLDIPEEPIQTSSGETRFLHTKKVPIVDSQGVPQFLLGISEDITARKQADLEMARLNEGIHRRTEEVEAANKELEAFSYSVSHDLRAPLRHIDGFADLLARQAGSALDETARRYLEAISSSAKEMGQLIDDLLSFSKMSRTQMQNTTVDLGQLVADVRNSLAEETAGRDIRWQIESLPVIRGDDRMLRVVFTNLLSNAVKYTGHTSSARIEVGTRDSKEEVVLYVRDNGVGFDMAYAHKLFGVFQRLHSDEEFEGTGIGLATVRRVIHRHGGRTWAEGEVNRGATIYVALPRALVLHETAAA